MSDKDYNPILQAIVSIRHLALGLANDWNQMKNIGNELDKIKVDLDSLVKKHGNNDTLNAWDSETQRFDTNVIELKQIMKKSVSQIKNREADGLSNNWENSNNYAKNISENFNELQLIGSNSLPENETEKWNKLWKKAYDNYDDITCLSNACAIQLKMIEKYKPSEVDEMTSIILKHIPLNYTEKEANKYEEEYLQAYKELKQEASQKKNLWDKFLDIIAGGTQQTPSQRVMMKRWVDGEKGEIH